ncbi:acyltransferase family protein [Devosia sp. CN2-171]|uniref:acyltransferase family protein n=1 Tax=Devosia sp. CN2-171 TaxID=3400909 RepID=UPI003BF87153
MARPENRGHGMDGKLYSVQYLRGLAAFLVVIAHAAAHPLATPLAVQARLGEFGVYLFFVISGFIMVAISGLGTFAPLDFLKRRATRIVPLYWIFTTLAAALALFLPLLFKSTVFTWPHYILSMLFLPHEAPGRGGTSPILSLGWTLNYEVLFYLVFAVLCGVAARQRVIVLTVAFLALYLFGALFRPSNPVLQFYTSHALLAFAAGAWVGLLHIDGRLAKLRRWAAYTVLAVGAAGAIVAFGLEQNPVETAPSFVGLLLTALALLVGGLHFERLLPRWNWLELMGDASYATYLSHMFVIGGVVGLGSRLLPDGTVSYLGMVGTAVVLATGLGLLVHLYMERPLLGLMRRRKPARSALAPAE